MKTRKITIVLTAIVIIAGSIFLMNYMSSMQDPPVERKEKEIKKYVKTIVVDYGPVVTEIVAYGRVRTAESLDLIAEKAGRMDEGKVLLKEGAKFKRGDLLFQIDDTEARLNLQSQKSDFLRDLAAILPDLKIDFPDNYQSWYDYFRLIDLNRSLPDLPHYKTDQEKTFLATKNIFSAYYNIKSAEESLRKYKLYAPFNGSFAEVTLQKGSFVNPGNKIARIIRTDRLEIKVDVETSDINWIKKGLKVKLNSEDGTQMGNGEVTRISDYVNQNTQSIDVYVTLEANQYEIYDGLFLQATIPGKKINNAMEISRAAVFDGNHVYVVQDTLLKVKEIVIHKVNPESVVFSGLDEGEDLVTEPLINAYNNMKVYKYPDDNNDKEIDIENKTSSKAHLVKKAKS